MITLSLMAQTEKLNPPNPCGFKQPPLYHQVRTMEALRHYDLVMNSYNTGTGKTFASLLHLFALKGQGKNVLVIAPTNALLAQHAMDIEQFIADNNLDFKVLRAAAADIRAYDSGLRPGETLQRLIRNYQEFEQQAAHRQPVVLVTNPDIFYYALYFRYGSHDRRNLFERFLMAFDYLVIDEFHYYDSKQFSNFLFAFALFDQFGYFDHQRRKICLLSATPSPAVVEYLDRLFGSRWIEVSPANEPAESADFATTPTLAPLELTLVAYDLIGWLSAHQAGLLAWIKSQELDGAVISSSLARINDIYARLRQVLTDAQMGRITGPEPAQERVKNTGKRLILASPTVDIGYNFIKGNKTRQNVDFIICDARYGDELIQRLGRAGRVLGKPQFDTPSRGVACLSQDAVHALAAIAGQTLSRAEFAQLVTACDELPPKHTLTGYIRTHAITESFWPIYQVHKMLPPDLEPEIEALYERVRSIFAPNSRRTRKGLQGFFAKFDSRQRWLQDAQKGQIKYDNFTAGHLSDWLAWLEASSVEERIEPAALRPHLKELLASDAQRQGLQALVQSQVALTRALFSFRDSFQGPVAVVYDPQHWLSSQTVNQYDLFHLLRNYWLSPPLGRRQFQQHYGSTELKGDYYFALTAQREPKLSLELVYETGEERDEFEDKWCERPVALNGLRLQVRERGGDILAGALEDSIVESVAQTYLPLLIVPPADTGAMIARLRNSSLWAQCLTVCFPDGTRDEAYRAFLGTAAFHADGELWSHFLFKDRAKPDAIIL